MFELWHRFRAGGCPRAELGAGMQPHVEALHEVILSGTECRDQRTRRYGARLLADAYGLWTFVETEGVDTVVQTLRLQTRNIVAYRSASIAAHRAGKPGPKLIPTG